MGAENPIYKWTMAGRTPISGNPPFITVKAPHHLYRYTVINGYFYGVIIPEMGS